LGVFKPYKGVHGLRGGTLLHTWKTTNYAAVYISVIRAVPLPCLHQKHMMCTWV